jgi:predicted AlkP superfamily phosphohydrolase/phosphomutase
MVKILVYGIDGAPPELIFDRWLDDLPNIKSLLNKGAYTKINSTIPPVTIIAWSAFASGKDASQIGAFSYTYKDHLTNKSRLISSTHVKTERVWDILSKYNKRSIILNVPLTYPVKPIKGIMISGFLTPDINSDCVYPKALKDKIKELGDTKFLFDVAGVAGHKSLDIDELLKRTYEMTNLQINILKELIVNEEWDFLMQVLIGSDRLQHMLWKHFDPTHKRFIENSKYKNALKDYYIYLDKRLGEIISLLDKDTIVIVSSDHGMIKQEGKININNWLIEKGYLVLTKEFAEEIKHKKTRQRFEGIDFNKTIAYATGAYHARVFIDQSIIPKEDYNKIRNKLIEELKQITDDKGNKLKTEVFKAEDIYHNPNATGCPDLTVYFDELRWASNPDFGLPGLYSWKSALGADSAGHSKQGIFIISGAGISNLGKIKDINIKQVTPTILQLMGLPIPKDIKHKPIEVVK